MRRLIATVFNFSLDGFLADEGTDFWEFCFSRPENANPDEPSHLEFLRNTSVHVFGRHAYESISAAMMAATDHPFSPILNAAPKVVISKTLKTAEWPNTTIASGDLRDEVEQLKGGGDGHMIVWGGVSLWRSLIELDLLDELHVSLFPYIAGEGTKLFDGAPRSYAMELISSEPSSGGVAELRYRRAR